MPKREEDIHPNLTMKAASIAMRLAHDLPERPDLRAGRRVAEDASALLRLARPVIAALKAGRKNPAGLKHMNEIAARYGAHVRQEQPWPESWTWAPPKPITLELHHNGPSHSPWHLASEFDFEKDAA